MIPPLSRSRYERKFLAAGLSLAEALALIRRHPALFRETYPVRVVNNVYLDSPGLRDYFDHVHGVSDRRKTRVRWYGTGQGRIEAPVLERKLKRGAVSGKAACPLPPLSLNGGLTPVDLAAAFGSDALPEVWREALRHLQPALFNRYQRHYFESADGRFRLTADTGLESARLNGAGSAGTLTGVRGLGVILELKFDPRHADLAAAVTNALPFRLARCSKYVLGIGVV